MKDKTKVTIWTIVFVIIFQIFIHGREYIALQFEYLTGAIAIYKIESDLEARFGEPFVYDNGYAYPLRYVGTTLEEDKYYHGGISVKNQFPLRYSDSYDKTVLSHSANKFYQPKVEELFGKNVVLALEPQWDNEMWDNDEFTDYKTGLDYFKKLQHEYQGDDDDAPYHKLEGGIYIYGKVDSDADREEYREKIWEFINYIKEVGAFDQVDLGIIVIDERVLTDQFASDKELKADIIEARFKDIPREVVEREVRWIDNKYEFMINDSNPFSNSPHYEYNDDEEFRVKRRELISKITEPVDKSKKHERLENINIHNNYKSKGGSNRTSFYNSLLVSNIKSIKKWDSIGGSKLTKRTNYDVYHDVEFYKQKY